MKNNKKGFTLAELLVVVAIIAVLVAIAIPVFTAQLEKSREAVDAANIRAAYAEVMVDVVSGESTTTTKTVKLKQEDPGWGSTFDWPENLKGSDGIASVQDGSPSKGGTAVVAWNAEKKVATCTFNAAPNPTETD